MTFANAEDEFARMLGALEGQDFQDEVCRFLRRSHNDFQHVPPKPQGDAGLDGYSHGQTIAYCCYGPEGTANLTAKALAKKTIEKFRDDLRRLFEVKPDGKKGLVHSTNNGLPTIMATGGKFVHVQLIVSVLNSHEVLGPLSDAFNACKQASGCTYVDKSATFRIMSSKELATMGAVDDATVLRLQQRKVVKQLELVLEAPPISASPLQTSDFDAKFDWLDANGKPGPGGTTAMRSHFMKRWLTAIAVENDLANNAPALHQALSALRERVVVDAELESKTQPGAGELIKVMRVTLREQLQAAFASSLPPETVARLVDGELGLLIGVCPVNWIGKS